jgi:serine/threonine protein kinase
MAASEVADIVFQCCCGLEELHNSHIIHRDIKLENLMYKNSKIKIVDLGCSNFYGASIARKTTIGTRLYYSPEIILQEEQNDKLDIWCLGVVLYEMLYLQNPFNEPDIEKKIRVRPAIHRKWSIPSLKDK